MFIELVSSTDVAVPYAVYHDIHYLLTMMHIPRFILLFIERCAIHFAIHWYGLSRPHTARSLNRKFRQHKARPQGDLEPRAHSATVQVFHWPPCVSPPTTAHNINIQTNLEVHGRIHAPSEGNNSRERDREKLASPDSQLFSIAACSSVGSLLLVHFLG